MLSHAAIAFQGGGGRGEEAKHSGKQRDEQRITGPIAEMQPPLHGEVAAG